MTMHIVFQKDHDGYKNQQECYVERVLARRFCENGTAIPYQKHLDNLYDDEQAAKKMKEDAKAEKEKADAKKKAELLKKKESAAMFEKADSKKQKRSEKAVKNNLAQKGAY